MEKDYLLKKWLNDELNAEETRLFKAEEDFDLHKRIVDEATRFKASPYSKMRDFEALEQKLPAKSTGGVQWKSMVLRIAAILVIGIGLYVTLFSNKDTTIETLAAEKTTLELPDSSEVRLNASSMISFNEKNWNKKRALSLRGEAYFKVAKGAIFDVTTDAGVVTVVGTQFNVKQRPNYFEVTCYEGIVKVQTATETKELRIGDSFRVVDQTTTVSRTDKMAPAWTRNASYFTAVPFDEVIQELERQYNIQVSYASENDTITFTGGFPHDSLNNALNAITQPLGLTYKIDSTTNVSIKSNDK